MTAFVAVSQRVVIESVHGERRDALDQRWTAFLSACGMTPVLLPNDAVAALNILEAVPVRGLLLTGGNSLVEYGGDAPERDRTELACVAHARSRRLPILGVCRGMQVILNVFQVPLRQIGGHAGCLHQLVGGRRVNSFHDFAAMDDCSPLLVAASTEDGVVEAVEHPVEDIHGIMWHPERCQPFDDADLRLFQRIFLTSGS